MLLQSVRFLRKALLVSLVAGLVLIAAVYAYTRVKRPELQARAEIYRGVFYECVDLPPQIDGHGRAMVIEVHLDTPGVEVVMRPFDLDALEAGGHYTLSFADFEIREHSLEILSNGVRYNEAEWWRSLPGIAKPAHETVVVDGAPSHVHKHSYLLWSDREGNLALERSKPPPQHALENAVWGVGLQGIGVNNGQVSRYLQNGGASAEIIRGTFIGIDPERSILWLLAFEAATEAGMSAFAAQAGVIHGGMLDSDDGTSVIIGKGAQGVPPYTGIRGGRPLASWIGIRAEPLPER